MATSTTHSGVTSIRTRAEALLGTDREGSEVARYDKDIAWAATGGTAPTQSGFLKGTATCAAGDWLLAHATDPLQGMGDAAYSSGFTVAGAKLKELLIENLDTVNSITIIRGAANGLPVFLAAGDGVTLAPGDILHLYVKAGTAALTTGSNDKLTISVSGGSPTATVFARYGA